MTFQFLAQAVGHSECHSLGLITWEEEGVGENRLEEKILT